MKTFLKLCLIIGLFTSLRIIEGNAPKFSCSFSAYSTSNIDLKKKGTIIAFRSTYLNENNCYNTCNGIFKPLLDGIYYFHWKITTHDGKSAAARFHVNGQYSGPDVLAISGGIYHNSVSSFAVVRLKRGDRVNLVSNADNAFIGGYHSGFGGFFVSE